MTARRTRMWLALTLAVALFLVASPGPTSADHCGALAVVEPSSGPPGTEFTLLPNLGGATRLTLYHWGRKVRVVSLTSDHSDRYEIRAGPNDMGRWTAQAALVSAPDCRSQASWTVVAAPDTSTSPPATRGPDNGRTATLVLLATFGVAFCIALRRPVQVNRRRGATGTEVTARRPSTTCALRTAFWRRTRRTVTARGIRRRRASLPLTMSRAT